MTLYIDSSTFMKLYVDEPDSDECRDITSNDRSWVSGRHSLVEVRRNLARILMGESLHTMRRSFAEHWHRTTIVELDARVSEHASEIAERTLVRALDALHLAAAISVEVASLLTYDRRQARAARDLGLNVLGV